MAKTFSADPTELGFHIVKDQPPANKVLTRSLTITASEAPGGAITLAKVGSAAWLTIPATCTTEVAFDVTVVESALGLATEFRNSDVTELIRASRATFTDLDVTVKAKQAPGGEA